MRGHLFPFSCAALSWVACSSTPAHVTDRSAIVTHARDAGPADAAGASDGDASEVDDAVEADPPADDRYRFEWHQLRDEYAAFRSSPIGSETCDFRERSFRQSVNCPGPHQMAGLVLKAAGGRKEGTVGIVIDRGRRDMITTEWMVAVLDDEGHPVTPWAPIDALRWDSESHAEVEAPRADEIRNHHVGMRIDQRSLETRLRREGKVN